MKFDHRDYLGNLYRPALERRDRRNFVCLDKNEAPFSAFDNYMDILGGKNPQDLRIYPDPYPTYSALSDFLNLDISNLLLTNGSEQALRFIFDTFLDEGFEVILQNPTFAMLPVFAYYRKAKLRSVSFGDDRSMPVESITSVISDKTSLVVLTNPNNPTGFAFSMDELEEIVQVAQEHDAYLVLDEAYFHYFVQDTCQLVSNFANVIITRTFSKAWGLAAIRAGYAISNPENIELLRKQKPIDELSEFSLLACQKAMEKADHIIKKNVEQVSKWKKIFGESPMTDMRYLPTEGNFILLRSQKYSQHKALFLENGVLPKFDFEHPSVENCFRLSVAGDEQMRKVLELFK